jgi:hypothetical protein
MNFRLIPLVLTASLPVTASAVAQDAALPPPANEAVAQQREDFVLSELERIARGFRVAPVQLDLRGKDLALVGLGSYLVNAAGGCNDCHTNPPFAAGGDPFQGQPKRINTAGYLAGGTAFGPFVSRNLTPDPATGRPAGLTYPDFRRTLRTGVDLKELHPEISPLLQVMPWPVYQDMIERDLRAIYEYLRAIPRAEPVP